MSRKKIIVIGNGKMAVDCAQIILRQIEADARDWELAFVAIDSSRADSTEALEKYCADTNLPHARVAKINAPEFLAQLRGLAPELIFSINNFQLIREALIATPSRGIINFHNAPLPRYAGSNAPTWAIFHGETTHGVTWHYVDAGIDSGDIVAQARFEIPRDCTAIRLIMTCLVEGARIFAAALPAILRGDAPRLAQDRAERSFFAMKDAPNGGLMEVAWDFARLSRFVRSLHFHPFCNDVAHPAMSCDGRFFRVDEIALAAMERRGETGEVLEITDRICHFQCGDAVVSLTKVRDLAGRALRFQTLAEDYGVRPGALLAGAIGESRTPACSARS